MILRFYSMLVMLASLVSSLITFSDVRVLTNFTNDCTKEIVDTDMPLVLHPAFAEMQMPNGGDDEVEDVVASALRLLDAYLLEMLNIPISSDAKNGEIIFSCSEVVQEYHNFVASTTLFLRALDEKQRAFMWRGGSPVYHALSWLQALWASSKVNEQHRSFIEQQMELYKPTGCFGKSNEVLRRDVEIVEYMNDLIDSFA